MQIRGVLLVKVIVTFFSWKVQVVVCVLVCALKVSLGKHAAIIPHIVHALSRIYALRSQLFSLVYQPFNATIATLSM